MCEIQDDKFLNVRKYFFLFCILGHMKYLVSKYLFDIIGLSKN